MSFFSLASAAPKPKTQNAWLASLLLAAFFVILAVGQLFTFEKFPEVLEAWLPGGEVFATIAAALIVTFEVLALPFLLGLRLSAGMRVMSMMFGWTAILAWLIISAGSTVSGASINSGVLGATIALPAGWWSVLLFVALGVLAAWSAWGMWPLGGHKR